RPVPSERLNDSLRSILDLRENAYADRQSRIGSGAWTAGAPGFRPSMAADGPVSAKLPFDPVQEAERHWVDNGWEEAAAGMSAVTSVMRAQQIFLGRVDDALKEFGLTFARYEALMLLAFSRAGVLPLGKIGERLQVHAASV